MLNKIEWNGRRLQLRDRGNPELQAQVVIETFLAAVSRQQIALIRFDCHFDMWEFCRVPARLRKMVEE
jgi:hypothetical protein